MIVTKLLGYGRKYLRPRLCCSMRSNWSLAIRSLRPLQAPQRAPADQTCPARAGISQWPTEGHEQRYQSSTNLSSRVGGLNPRWNQDSSSAAADAAFQKAVALTGSEFLEAVDYVSKVLCRLAWMPL